MNIFPPLERKMFYCVILSAFLNIFLCACCAGELTGKHFTVRQDGWKKEHEGLKIVFFADLHLRKEIMDQKIFDELVEKVNKEEAHFILIGGDLIDRTTKTYLKQFSKEILVYLKRFRSKYGIILCSGNHEKAAEASSSLVTELRKNGFIYLDDDFYFPLVNGKRLALYGQKEKTVPKRKKKQKRIVPGWEYFHTPTEKLLRKNEFLQKGEPLLILSHRPELFDFLDKEENILILAGHYHGGLVDLPFLTAKTLLSWYQKRKYPKRPPLKYVYGKFEEGRKILYVTSGISGGDHSALRINVPREYTVITFFCGKKEKEAE